MRALDKGQHTEPTKGAAVINDLRGEVVRKENRMISAVSKRLLHVREIKKGKDERKKSVFYRRQGEKLSRS